MTQPAWQKSSFSSGGEGNCVELAAQPHPRLRESAHPGQVVAVSPRALAHLLRALKAGTVTTAL